MGNARRKQVQCKLKETDANILQGELGWIWKLSRTRVKIWNLAPAPRDCYIILNHCIMTNNNSYWQQSISGKEGCAKAKLWLWIFPGREGRWDETPILWTSALTPTKRRRKNALPVLKVVICIMESQTWTLELLKISEEKERQEYVVWIILAGPMLWVVLPYQDWGALWMCWRPSVTLGTLKINIKGNMVTLMDSWVEILRI